MSTTLSLHTGLGEIEAAWGSIEERNGRGAPLQSIAYARMWYEQFSTPEAVRVFSVWNRDDCIGILPMELAPGMGFAVLRSLKHEHSWHCPRIILRGKEPEFAACLLRGIADTGVHWDMCKFMYLYSFDSFGLELKKAAASSLPSGSHMAYRQPTYCINLAAGFEAYLQRSLNKKTRQAYRNKLARIKKRFTMRTLCLRGRDAAAQWDTFLRMEDSDWKGEQKNRPVRLTSKKKVQNLLMLC